MQCSLGNNNICNLVLKVDRFCIFLILIGMEFQFIGDIHLRINLQIYVVGRDKFLGEWF